MTYINCIWRFRMSSSYTKNCLQTTCQNSQVFCICGGKESSRPDEDQRPVRPSSSDPSPSKSAGKKDCKFQQVWLEKYRWLRFQKDRMSICDGLKFVIWERNNHVSVHRVFTVITFSLLL